MTFRIICRKFVNELLYILNSGLAKGTGLENVEFAQILGSV